MKHGAARYGLPPWSPQRCRCEICTRSHAARQRRQQRARAARLAEMPAVNHGTIGGYTNWGCRCPDCTRANTEACKARKQRRGEAS